MLGAACVGIASLRIDNNPISNVKGNPGSVVGQHLLGAHFPAGASNPPVVLAPQGQAGAAARCSRSSEGRPGGGEGLHTVVDEVDHPGEAVVDGCVDLEPVGHFQGHETVQDAS